METKKKYPFGVGIIWSLKFVLIIAFAAFVTWYHYGTTKNIPLPIETRVIENYEQKGSEFKVGVPQSQRMLRPGEKITVLARVGSEMWVEAENGDRGLFPQGYVENWDAIRLFKDMDHYQVELNNFVNIGKKQMEKEYLGRSFQDNETNYWPALSKCTIGDTLFATYQLRMWDGKTPLIPTVCYVNDVAVAITSYAEAPFEGNINWLKAMPWASWLYTTPFFKVHWDKPLIPRRKIELKNWWWIFRVPVKIVLLILALIILLYWRTVVCNPLALLILMVYPFRIFFRKWSNSQVFLFGYIVILLNTLFYIPLFLLDHGSFVTICIVILIVLVGITQFYLMARQRCEQCLNVGFIKVFHKSLNHTDYETERREERGEEVGRTTHLTKEIEKTLDANDNVVDEQEIRRSKRVYITYRYDEYEVTIEKKHYDHHCECLICHNYTVRENEEVEEKEIEKKWIRSFLKTKYSFIESL